MWIKHMIWKRTTMCGSQFLQVWPTPIWGEICWSKPSGQINQTIRHPKKLASVGVWKFGDPKTHNCCPHHDYPMTPGRTSANLCRTENHILFHLRALKSRKKPLDLCNVIRTFHFHRRSKVLYLAAYCTWNELKPKASTLSLVVRKPTCCLPDSFTVMSNFMYPWDKGSGIDPGVLTCLARRFRNNCEDTAWANPAERRLGYSLCTAVRNSPSTRSFLSLCIKISKKVRHPQRWQPCGFDSACTKSPLGYLVELHIRVLAEELHDCAAPDWWMMRLAWNARMFV